MKKRGVVSVQSCKQDVCSYRKFLHASPHLLGLVCCLIFSSVIKAQDAENLSGEMVAFETSRGNCLACHHIPGGTQMGDIGPPLNDIRVRFPDRKRLYEQIWDAGVFNIKTLMPPYGRQKLLTEQEINSIIDFLYTK